MHLNHLDLHSPDVAATADALTLFGLRLVDMRGNAGLAILTDDEGLELVVSHAVERHNGIDQAATGTVSYHIGFIVADRGDVDRTRERLITAGLDPGPTGDMRGGWQFYCLIPGHILVEVGARALHV